MEDLKPSGERRPEPKRPTAVERPADRDDTAGITAWSAAAKVLTCKTPF